MAKKDVNAKKQAAEEVAAILVKYGTNADHALREAENAARAIPEVEAKPKGKKVTKKGIAIAYLETLIEQVDPIAGLYYGIIMFTHVLKSHGYRPHDYVNINDLTSSREKLLVEETVDELHLACVYLKAKKNLPKKHEQAIRFYTNDTYTKFNRSVALPLRDKLTEVVNMHYAAVLQTALMNVSHLLTQTDKEYIKNTYGPQF